MKPKMNIYTETSSHSKSKLHKLQLYDYRSYTGLRFEFSINTLKLSLRLWNCSTDEYQEWDVLFDRSYKTTFFNPTRFVGVKSGVKYATDWWVDVPDYSDRTSYSVNCEPSADDQRCFDPYIWP